MIKTLAVMATVAVVALAACTAVRGPGERGMSDDEIDAKDHAICASFGINRGSPGYADCRLRLRSDRSQQDSARRIGARMMAR